MQILELLLASRAPPPGLQVSASIHSASSKPSLRENPILFLSPGRRRSSDATRRFENINQASEWRWLPSASAPPTTITPPLLLLLLLVCRHSKAGGGDERREMMVIIP